MKLLLCFIIFWVNSNGQDIAEPVLATLLPSLHNATDMKEPEEEDSRLFQYKECLTNTKSLLYDKYSAEYESFNRKYNQAFGKVYPIAIFTPKSTNDVQAAVKCGVETGIQLVPISGGHSFAGLSYGTNDSILIDFRHMKSITFNSDETVTIESGALLGSVHYALAEKGFMAPIGLCMNVGMGGYILGGGLGHFANKFGIAADSLTEINMVDASGNAILVNESNNTDLWWAMRGIGSGYVGLLISVKMKVARLADLDFVHMKIRYRNDNFKTFMEAYIRWLNWVDNQEDDDDQKISSVITVRRDDITEPETKEPLLDRRGILLDIIKIQDPKMRGRNLNVTFMKAALDIFVANLEYHSFQIDYPNFIETLARISYGPMRKYHERLDIGPNVELFSRLFRENEIGDQLFYQKVKSFIVKKSQTANVTVNSFEEVQKILSEMPQGGSILIDAERGQISRTEVSSTAYVHRDSFLNIKLMVNTDNEADFESSKQWLSKLFESLQFLDSGETFQNYPDRDLLENNDYLRRYYGENLEKLIDIKRKWDPSGYFNSMMSLPISLP